MRDDVGQKAKQKISHNLCDTCVFKDEKDCGMRRIGCVSYCVKHKTA